MEEDKKLQGAKIPIIKTSFGRTQTHHSSHDSGLEEKSSVLPHGKKSKKNRNVLTRMEEPEQGPLCILQRSVQDKIQLKVWTRSSAHIRGICTGYLIAYDKHFNLAMLDVEEVYRNPVVHNEQIAAAREARRNKRQRKRWRRLRRQEHSAVGKMLDLLPYQVDGTANPSSSAQIHVEPKDLLSKCPIALSKPCLDEGQNNQLCSVKGACGLKENKEIPQSGENYTSDTSDLDSDNSSSNGEMEQGNNAVVHPNTPETVACPSRRIHSYNKPSPCQSASQKPNSESHKPHRQHDQSSHVKVRDDNSQRFIGRHINQLFIRGDNVVMVALVPD